MIKTKQSRVVLFGSKEDPEVKRSIEKIKLTGRSVDLTPRPSFDTGIGQCGNHLCSCSTTCMQTAKAITI